jgi:A/G-specific adenine glycosylase
MTADRSILPCRRLLLRWYETARRDLPWRRTRDPYRIWVSEIMLQQTRVAAVIPYYEAFLERFPDAAALARAPEEELLACWSGLGYYSRARNLRRAAILIAQNGGFPRRYDAIRELPGIGDYTAAAIASIAFGLPYAAIDGNVARVLARLTEDRGEISAPATRARLRETAAGLLDRRAPGAFNQAMMELGATVCLPRAPQCPACPLAPHCRARLSGTARELPVKLRRAGPIRIDRTVLVIEKAGRVLLWQRGAESSRMAGFWELPEQAELSGAIVAEPAGEVRHTITNHRYRVAVARARIRRAPAGYRWFSRDELARIPVSTLARKALAVCGRMSAR